MQWKISKDNNADLGFAITCLFNRAINLNEFKKWLEIVITDTEIFPAYIFDLLDFNDYLFRIFETIGFVPDSFLSQSQENAIIGIAYLRNQSLFDVQISKQIALQTLNQEKDMQERFAKFFPFINLKF